MNDDEMLTALRSSLVSTKDALDEVHFERPVSAVVGKARGRRLQRGLSAGAAGGVALGVGLALGLSGGGQAAARGVHVNLDGFSVNTTSDGLVNVTIGDLKDPAKLRAALAQAGIPAIVNVGKYCYAAHVVLPQLQNIVRHETPGGTVWLLNPAAIPPGTKLSMGVAAHLPTSQPPPATDTSPSHPEPAQAISVLTLVRDGSKLTCQPIP